MRPLLTEHACSRYHDARDECGHAGEQQKLIESSSHCISSVSYVRETALQDSRLVLAQQSKSTVIWNRAVQSNFCSGSDASRATLDVAAQVRNLVAIDRAL